jgi:hypothetical protein
VPVNFCACRHYKPVKGINRLHQTAVDRLSCFPNPHFPVKGNLQGRVSGNRQSYSLRGSRIGKVLPVKKNPGLPWL